MRMHVIVLCTVNIVAVGQVLTMMIEVFWNERTCFVYSSAHKARSGTRQSSQRNQKHTFLLLISVVTFHPTIIIMMTIVESGWNLWV